jgi:hypothetical protein
MDKRGIMEDTLKTSAVGITGSALTGLGILPDVVSVAVGIVTIVYLLVKIRAELTKTNNKEK